jgi:hypothetical protein
MSEKICKGCGEVKPLAEFYKHKMMKDGHLNKCKACKRAYATKHRDENIERIRAYDRARSKTPARLSHLRENSRAQRVKFPEKRRARVIVGNAIRRGDLIRCACERCGKVDGSHAHHEDYSKPLNVVWLCSICHAARHKEMRAEAPSA